jgi:hypothetical protein
MTNGTHTGGEPTLGNQDNLPVVTTCYSIYEFNEAVKNGHQTCIMKITDNEKLRLKGILLRNKTSGEYIVVKERRMYVQYGRIQEYPVDEWEAIYDVSGYARTRPAHEGWGAYILPHGVKPGDRLYIEDLLEDLVAFEFWYSVGAAVDGEGIWTGSTIEIDEKLYRRFERIG